MKKYSGIMIILAIFLGVVSLIIADTYLPYNETDDYENSDITDEKLLGVIIDGDSVCVIYRVRDYISNEISAIKYVHKVENDTLAYKYAIAGEYIPEHTIEESYKFGE